MQSVIVYSNPIQAVFWESLSNGLMFPMMVWIMVCICTVAGGFYLIENVFRYYVKKQYVGFIAIVLGLVSIWFTKLILYVLALL